jgi:type VI secretion system protein VasD
MLAYAAALTSCAAPPKPPPPTVLNVTINAGKDINPAADGTASPVVLRVYQLGSAASFGNAEFYPLYTADAATLGADLIKREDNQLSPGDSKTVTIDPADPVKAVAFFAGLRSFQSAKWRASTEFPPHQTTNITVTLAGSGITLKTVTLPPPKPAS